MAQVIRTVMPEFGASGPGFAINDPEVDHLSVAYSAPRAAFFVLVRDGRARGVRMVALGPSRVRAVTHLDVSRADVDVALAEVAAVLRQR